MWWGRTAPARNNPTSGRVVFWPSFNLSSARVSTVIRGIPRAARAPSNAAGGGYAGRIAAGWSAWADAMRHALAFAPAAFDVHDDRALIWLSANQVSRLHVRWGMRPDAGPAQRGDRTQRNDGHGRPAYRITARQRSTTGPLLATMRSARPRGSTRHARPGKTRPSRSPATWRIASRSGCLTMAAARDYFDILATRCAPTSRGGSSRPPGAHLPAQALAHPRRPAAVGVSGAVRHQRDLGRHEIENDAHMGPAAARGGGAGVARY